MTCGKRFVCVCTHALNGKGVKRNGQLGGAQLFLDLWTLGAQRCNNETRWKSQKAF